MTRGNELLAIGELASRTGLSVSAIRFYEAKGLVQALRTAGGQRRFLRSDIRRLSFALIAQQVGTSFNPNFAGALGVILLLVSLAIVVAYNHILARLSGEHGMA